MVTFNKNGGGTEASPTTKTVNSIMNEYRCQPTAPTRAGYTFNGWNTAADGSGTFIFRNNNSNWQYDSICPMDGKFH
ncbi:MAG TPA: InlB B-repeat-containing protein [Ruminiclostridium sp.]|nr:InlB B-repeat-containing protein [Ruminiclostridium sp.]